MISGYTDITGPLILMRQISEYTDIAAAALSCDIGVLRISRFQISYPISKFQISDIGTYTDVTIHDIGVSQISEFLMSYPMCLSPADPQAGFPDALARIKSVGGPQCSALNCIKLSCPASSLAATVTFPNQLLMFLCQKILIQNPAHLSPSK